jgi:hypothetical protein
MYGNKEQEPMNLFTTNRMYTPEFRTLVQHNEQSLLLGSEMNANFVDWEKERAFLSEPITTSGTILDFGCANGFLLRSFQEWTGLGKALVPYGVDTNAEHIQEAKQLFPEQKDHFVTSDRFLQTPIKERPNALQGPFNYVYWNVWDNLPVSENNDEYFKGYFTQLLAITKNEGKLIMGFYQADQNETNKKIAHINNLLRTESIKNLGIQNAEIIKNPNGVQMAMAVAILRQ